MHVLLVHPAFPITYWGFQHALPIVGKRATLPPLGLITVAAHLPPSAAPPTASPAPTTTWCCTGTARP